MTKNDKSETLIYTGLFCLALYVCLASCLNPFALINIDIDTSIFLTIAQGITRGQVPFRDFFDNKGPLLYLISAPGFAMGRFTGVWITELIIMCVSVFFAYKTALFFGSRAFAFIGVVLSFIVFQSFFYEVAGTEEYSLPFMMISFYIFTKYYFSQENVLSLEIIILGFCFASTLLIRINIFSLWLGFCVIICIETVKKRDYAGLLKYIVLFFIGISIITVPVMLYLKINNAFTDYIQANFIAGGSQGFRDFSFKTFVSGFFVIIYKNFCFTPLLAGFTWIIKDFAGKKRGYYIGYLVGFILTVVFFAVIGTCFDHYNMTLTSFLVPAFTFFLKEIFIYFRDMNKNKVCFTLFLCILFSGPYVKGLSRIYFSFTSFTHQSRGGHILTGKIIDEQTTKGDKIIFLGFSAHIYLFSQRDTASRFIYQPSAAVNHFEGAQNEFLMDIYRNRPAIIAVDNRGGPYDYLPEWYAPIYAMIKNEYQMITDKNGYFLFKRIQKGNT